MIEDIHGICISKIEQQYFEDVYHNRLEYTPFRWVIRNDEDGEKHGRYIQYLKHYYSNTYIEYIERKLQSHERPEPEPCKECGRDFSRD